MISEQIVEEMQTKLANSHYDVHWTTADYKSNREKWRQEVEAAKQRFKSDLFVYLKSMLGEVTKEQFESVFNYAWELGHSSGYNEVWLCFNEVAELISKFTWRARI